MAVDLDRRRRGLNQVESDNLNDALAGLADGSLIGNDAIDSQHYVAGSIDLEHMSANSVDSDQYVDGSIDTVHIGNLQVTTGKLAADAVTGAKIGDDQIDSEHYVAGSIDTEHLGNLQVTEGKLASSAVAQGKLKTATSSASGTLTTGTGVVITFGAYVFWPMFNASGGDVYLICAGTSGTADESRVRLFNSSGADRDYSVLWRQVSA